MEREEMYTTLVWALDGGGSLVHVDDVANGLACGCVCPDPNCAQPLVARNAGVMRMHHFAHQRGTCQGSQEHVVARLATKFVSEGMTVFLPWVGKKNPVTGFDDTAKAARLAPVVSVAFDAGRPGEAPAVIMGIDDGGIRISTVALVVCLTRPLAKSRIDGLKRSCDGVLVLGMRSLTDAFRNAFGRHFDRDEVIVTMQDPEYVAWAINDPEHQATRWAWHRSLGALDARHAVERRLECERLAMERRRRAELIERRNKDWARLMAKLDDGTLTDDDLDGVDPQLYRDITEERHRRLEKKEQDEQRRKEIAAERMRIERLKGPFYESVAMADAGVDPEAYLMGRIPSYDVVAVVEMVKELFRAMKNQGVIARDRWGARWVLCKKCGHVGLEDDFELVGSDGYVNRGICNKCLHGS